MARRQGLVEQVVRVRTGSGDFYATREAVRRVQRGSNHPRVLQVISVRGPGYRVGKDGKTDAYTIRMLVEVDVEKVAHG